MPEPLLKLDREGNALLRVNSKRAVRADGQNVQDFLIANGFERGQVIRHSVARNGLREEVVTDWHRFGRNEDGSPRYDRARVTETFAR